MNASLHVSMIFFLNEDYLNRSTMRIMSKKYNQMYANVSN